MPDLVNKITRSDQEICNALTLTHNQARSTPNSDDKEQLSDTGKSMHCLLLREHANQKEGHSMWVAQPLKRRDVVFWKYGQREHQVHLEMHNEDICRYTQT